MSQLAAVILRLIAIRWLLEGISLALPSLRMLVERNSGGLTVAAVYFIMPVVVVAVAFLIWWFAAPVGRVIAGSADPEILQGSIRREDVFSTGVLVIGLWTALTYLGNSLSWIHYMVVSKSLGSVASSGDMKTFYDAVATLCPCVAGILLTIFCGPIGRRLAKAGPDEGKALAVE